MFLSDKSACEHFDEDAYSGTVSVTVSGYTCQRWDSQSPHSHSVTDADFPDASMSAAENYCRNPGEDKWPWCYTVESAVRWQYCKLPEISCCEYLLQQLD